MQGSPTVRVEVPSGEREVLLPLLPACPCSEWAAAGAAPHWPGALSNLRLVSPLHSNILRSS